MGMSTLDLNAQKTNYNEENHDRSDPSIRQAQDSYPSSSEVSTHLSSTKQPTRSRHSSFSSNTYPTSPITPLTPPPSYTSFSHQTLGYTGLGILEAQSTDSLSIASNLSELPTPANNTPEISVSRSCEELDAQSIKATDQSISLPVQTGPLEATANPRSTRFSLRYRRRSGLGP